MKKLSLLLSMLAVVFAVSFTSCKKEDPVIVEPDDTLEVAPEIAAPSAGNFIVAIRVPAATTCNGAVAVGSFQGWSLNSDTKFEKVSGTNTWYKISIPYAEDVAVKVIALTSDGKVDWGTQWGMNKEGEDPNVTFVGDNDGELDETENGGEVKLINVKDASVVFIDIKAWKAEPCTPKNEAGKATFTLTTSGLPTGASVGVVGNFPEKDWNIESPIVLTLKDGKYTVTTDVNAAQEYKYVWSANGTTWSWDNSEDGGNRAMPISLKAVDTVEKWKGIE